MFCDVELVVADPATFGYKTEQPWRTRSFADRADGPVLHVPMTVIYLALKFLI